MCTSRCLHPPDTSDRATGIPESLCIDLSTCAARANRTSDSPVKGTRANLPCRLLTARTGPHAAWLEGQTARMSREERPRVARDCTFKSFRSKHFWIRHVMCLCNRRVATRRLPQEEGDEGHRLEQTKTCSDPFVAVRRPPVARHDRRPLLVRPIFGGR